MAKGAIAKELITNAGNVADKIADWLRKDKEAQQEAVIRLGLPENNTAKDRAKAMGFGDTQYHGTTQYFDEFDPSRTTKGIVYTSPDTELANTFATDFKPEGALPMVMPVKTRGNVFDYENPEHLELIKNEIRPPDINDGLSTMKKGIATNSVFNKTKMLNAIKEGKWQILERSDVQDTIKGLGFDGFNVTEGRKGWSNAKNTGLYDASNIRSPLAHFNPKYAGVGAGSVMSGNLMADENNEKQRKLMDLSFLEETPRTRNDGYVDDLPYPDMQANPNALREFLGDLATDPRQNMPMAGTLNNRQLMQGSERVNDFANWLENTKESITSHQKKMRDTYPSLNPLNNEDPMSLGDFLIGNAPKAIKAHNENRPTEFWDDMDMMFLGADTLAGGLGIKAGIKGLGNMFPNTPAGLSIKSVDDIPTGAPKNPNDNLPPTRAFGNDKITNIADGKESRITRASNEQPVNSFLGSPAEDVVKYDELGNPIVTPKVKVTDANGNVYEQPADELNAPMIKGLDHWVAKELGDDTGSITNNSAFADSQNLDAIAKSKKMSQDQKDAFVEQYGKTPEFEASKSEQHRWLENKKTTEASDANHNIGTGSNFDPKNVQDSVSTYKGKVDNNLVSDIKDPKHKKIIKSVKSTINYQRRAGDTSTGVDRSNIDYKMNKLVELLSDVENRTIVGVNKKRELEAKENLVNWINQNIEELQNKSMMQVDGGNLKNTPTKKSLEVLGEDKGTIKRDKNTFREEREMDYGWNDVEDSPKSLLEPKTMNMDNKPPSMTITPDDYSPKLRNELNTMSLKDGYTVDSVLDYFRPLEADGIKPEQVYSSFNKFKHEMTGYDNAGKVLNGKEHKVYNYEMHSQFAQIMRDNNMPKVADYIMQMLENRGL